MLVALAKAEPWDFRHLLLGPRLLDLHEPKGLPLTKLDHAAFPNTLRA